MKLEEELIKETADYILHNARSKDAFSAGLIIGACFNPETVVEILDEVHRLEEKENG